MKMIIMPEPGANPVQPAAIAGCFATQRALDHRVYEDAVHSGIASRQLEQLAVLGTPYREVNVLTVFGDDAGGRHLVALDRIETAIRHWRQPDVAFDAELMRSMPGKHRATARLSHVADQHPAPPDGFAGGSQALQECDQGRMAPGAVARRAHYLPDRTVSRHFDRAGQAALCIGADRLARTGGGRRSQPEPPPRRIRRQRRQYRLPA